MKFNFNLTTFLATFGLIVTSHVANAQFNDFQALPPSADDFKAYAKFNPTYANIYLTTPENAEQKIGTIQFSGGLPVKKEITRAFWGNVMSSEEFWVWNEFGKLKSYTSTSSQEGEGITQQYSLAWDYQNGLPSKSIQTDIDAALVGKRLFITKNGKCERIDLYANDDEMLAGETGTITYDAKGRISQIVFTSFDFESLEETTQYSIVYTYNSQGLLTKQTSYMGKIEDDFVRDTTEYEYNAQGLLIKMKIEHNMSPISEVLRFEYVK